VLLLGLVVAGAVGAPTRYLVDGIVLDRTDGTLPLGTLVINTSGSLLLGLIAGLALYHAFPSTPKTVLGTGFCGAYTTFSTFTYEVVRLLEERAAASALRILVASLIVPTGAAALGLAIASL
jgi:CrcB protein